MLAQPKGQLLPLNSVHRCLTDEAAGVASGFEGHVLLRPGLVPQYGPTPFASTCKELVRCD